MWGSLVMRLLYPPRPLTRLRRLAPLRSNGLLIGRGLTRMGGIDLGQPQLGHFARAEEAEARVGDARH